MWDSSGSSQPLRLDGYQGFPVLSHERVVRPAVPGFVFVDYLAGIPGVPAQRVQQRVYERPPGPGLVLPEQVTMV